MFGAGSESSVALSLHKPKQHTLRFYAKFGSQASLYSLHGYPERHQLVRQKQRNGSSFSTTTTAASLGSPPSNRRLHRQTPSFPIVTQIKTTGYLLYRNFHTQLTTPRSSRRRCQQTPPRASSPWCRSQTCVLSRRTTQNRSRRGWNGFPRAKNRVDSCVRHGSCGRERTTLDSLWRCPTSVYKYKP